MGEMEANKPSHPGLEVAEESSGQSANHGAAVIVLPLLQELPGHQLPHTLTNFYIDNILRPDFGRRKEAGGQPPQQQQQQQQHLLLLPGRDNLSPPGLVRERLGVDGDGGGRRDGGGGGGGGRDGGGGGRDDGGGGEAEGGDGEVVGRGADGRRVGVGGDDDDDDGSGGLSSSTSTASSHAKRPRDEDREPDRERGRDRDRDRDRDPQRNSHGGGESGDLSHGGSDSDTSQGSANGGTSQPMLWPAWVYCTRYSDRPSSGWESDAGPRSRKPKKKIPNKEDKRPRTAFTAEQLQRLKAEFQTNRYLTEQRRQNLAQELGLNESQIKIWFQNKRAKIKKASGSKNILALHLMAQGLYNHSSNGKADKEDSE